MSTQPKDTNNKTTDNNSPSTKEQDPDFHGAAIIDDDGKEIPITEDMIQEACADLEPQSEQADNDKASEGTPSENQ